MMVYKRIVYWLIHWLLTLSPCQAQDRPRQIPDKSTPTQSLVLTVNPQKTYQPIDHFGASDAWACQFVGNWPVEARNRIADLLFSRDTLANGQPRGIGLSLWRFNIGAGTAEQGPASGIKDEWRRAESFLQDDGSYNWNKQAGQLWFIQAARQRGVAQFLAFANSPPVQLTTNQKGYATNGQPNLRADQYDRYADFLAKVVAGIRAKIGITFQYVSPVNEPQWDWSDAGQEGTPFNNHQISALTRSLSAALLTHQLTTKINIAEAGQIDYLYADHNRPGRASQVMAFFQESSPDYVGDLPNVYQAISGHSYFTTSPADTAVAKRNQLRAALARHATLKYWMSEYCILGDNQGEMKGEGRDLGINPALYVASVIHNDLTQAHASAWHWWLALSPYDYKDGLIYVDKTKAEGRYQAAKMLWALGQYSQFIRPGAVRVEAVVPFSSKELLVSAYQNTDHKLVTVIVNKSAKVVRIGLVLTKGSLVGVKGYQTSETGNLTPLETAGSKGVVVGPRSITTLVGAYHQ